MPVSCEVTDDLAPKVKAIMDAGLRFTCEAINDNVAICIENDEEDLAIDIAMNRPGDESTGPKATLEKLIRNFKVPVAAEEEENER